MEIVIPTVFSFIIFVRCLKDTKCIVNIVQRTTLWQLNDTTLWNALIFHARREMSTGASSLGPVLCSGSSALVVLTGCSAAGRELALWGCETRVLIPVIKEGVVLLVNTSVQTTSSWDSLLFLYTYFLHGSVNCRAGQMKVIKNMRRDLNILQIFFLHVLDNSSSFSLMNSFCTQLKSSSVQN